MPGYLVVVKGWSSASPCSICSSEITHCMTIETDIHLRIQKGIICYGRCCDKISGLYKTGGDGAERQTRGTDRQINDNIQGLYATRKSRWVSLTWKRHCFASHNGSLCNCWVLQRHSSHNRNKAGWVHWRKLAAPGSKWRGTWECLAAYVPERSAGDPGESLL